MEHDKKEPRIAEQIRYYEQTEQKIKSVKDGMYEGGSYTGTLNPDGSILLQSGEVLKRGDYLEHGLESVLDMCKGNKYKIDVTLNRVYVPRLLLVSVSTEPQ